MSGESTTTRAAGPMSPDVRRAYDEATVLLCRATSSAAALAVADHDERVGLPAYDDAEGVQPRQQLLVCPASGCGHRFWTSPGASHQRFCSTTCGARWNYAQRTARRREAA